MATGNKTKTSRCLANTSLIEPSPQLNMHVNVGSPWLSAILASEGMLLCFTVNHRFEGSAEQDPFKG